MINGVYLGTGVLVISALVLLIRTYFRNTETTKRVDLLYGITMLIGMLIAQVYEDQTYVVYLIFGLKVYSAVIIAVSTGLFILLSRYTYTPCEDKVSPAILYCMQCGAHGLIVIMLVLLLEMT